MPGADVLVSGDSSVSKLHANLLLSERSGVSEGEQRPILVIRDTSTFGTFVNKIRVGEAPVELTEGDTIRFGTKSTFRIQWLPIICCYGLDVHLNDVQQKQCIAAGITLSERWSSECTHILVSPSSPLGAIHACGKFSDKHVVGIQWILEVLDHHVHRSNLPIMSDFQKDLPVCSPVNQSSLDLLQGVRLMWATRSEDPYCEALARLFGATIVNQTSPPVGKEDGNIAVFGGSRTPDISYVPPSAVGRSWTNEKMLLNAVCSADKSYMIQAPARTTALEQESVSVLSSGDEQDHDTVVLEESLKSPASSVKLKRPIDDASLQSSIKRQKSSPVQESTPLIVPSPLKDSEEKVSHLDGMSQKSKPDIKDIKQHKKGGAGDGGLASIFAAVLDSDEEQDICGGPYSREAGVVENDLKICRADTSSHLDNSCQGLHAKSRMTSTNMGIVGNQICSIQTDQIKLDKCERAAAIQDNVLQEMCKRKDEDGFQVVRDNPEEVLLEGIELNTKHKQDPKNTGLQPWRTVSVTCNEGHMGVNHGISIKAADGDEKCSEEPNSTLVLEPLLVSPKLDNSSLSKSQTMEKPNFKKFQKVWRTNSTSGGSLRLVAGDALYRETSFSSTDFVRAQKELQKSESEADALFKAELPRRVGLTGRTRVGRAKKSR